MMSIRLQNRSPPIIIYTEDDQDPSQPKQCCNLSSQEHCRCPSSRMNRTTIYLPLILPLGPRQEPLLKRSHHLEFSFILQHIKKSNLRSSSPHLCFSLFFSFSIFPSLLLSLSIFLSLFFLFFFKIFLLNPHLSHVQMPGYGASAINKK